MSEDAKRLTPESDLYQLLACVLDRYERVDGLIEDLQGHCGDSIDAFLEHRQHRPEIMQAGKSLIAAHLGAAMALARARKVEESRDWLRCVISFMSKGADTAAKFAEHAKNVTFFTFNFDSEIEERSASHIRGIYRGDPGLSQALQSVSVVHLHGRLADPPPKEKMVSEGVWVEGHTGSGVNVKWIDWTKAAAARIELVLDRIDDKLLRDVDRRISESEIMCFLGFGYEVENIKKLSVPHCLQRGHHHVFGSAYGLSQGKRDELVDLFGMTAGITLGDPSHECVEFLKSHHIMRAF